MADGDKRGSCYRWKGFSCLSHCVSFFYFSLEIFTLATSFSSIGFPCSANKTDRERYIVKSETVAESESGGITYSLSARLYLNICRLFNSPFTWQLVFHLHASGIMTSCLQLNLEGTKINEFGR